MFRRNRSSNTSAQRVALTLSLTLLVAACSGGSGGEATLGSNEPDELAFAEESEESTTTTRAPLEEVLLGSEEQPFTNLPSWDEPSAIRTKRGLILPVLDTTNAGYKVQTPCGNFKQITEGTEIGRAHVVLDPGHGGEEPGATGDGGAVEKELNLVVAKRTAEILEERGATVALTRETDDRVSLETRAEINNRIKPALFVSIHHNGGASSGGSKPGTIVFTKSGSPESKRFGGLFFEELTPQLEQAAQIKISAWEEYERQRLEHEALITTYEESVALYDAAVAENNRRNAQHQQELDDIAQQQANANQNIDAGSQDVIVLPAPVDLLPVPEVPTPPPAFALSPVRQFSWAGSGNAGVRSWAADGVDYLGVLRRSNDVPSVLAEFLYVTNPAEEELLLDPIFLDSQSKALADAVTRYFGTKDSGSGFVKDQTGDQNVGGGGSTSGCVDVALD